MTFKRKADVPVLQAETDVKRWQLEGGRTAKRVVELQAQLRAAQDALQAAERDLGERMADGVAVDMEAVTNAKDAVQQLTYAVAAATRKDEAAKQSLADAQRALEVDQEVSALAHLKNVALRVDALFIEIEGVIEHALMPAMECAKVASGEGLHRNYLVNLTQGFEWHLLRACKAIIPRGRAHVVLLKDTVYSGLVPDSAEAKARKQRGHS